MPTVEVTAKSMEEARRMAAEKLGCDETEMTVEVIDEPRRFLGIIGGAETRIRATYGDADAQESADEVSGDQEATSQEHEPAEEASGAALSEDDEAQAGIPQMVADSAREAVERIVALMGLDATVSVTSVSDDEVALEISGGDAGRIIGRHGATLDALQLLVAVIANHGLSRGARVILDAEGYRERREKMLRDMALAHAEQAKDAAKEIVIRDLKPYERRIIHLALVDDPDVETYSEGDDDDRQLVISPRI